jgi:cytochrome c2
MKKMTSLGLLAIAASFGAAAYTVTPAFADDDIAMPPVKDATVVKECGACHMVFQPGFLPARSWQKMMSELKDHFGENAELDAATNKRITEYLTANAADKSRYGGRGMRGVGASATPQRISQLPWFKRKHEKRDRISPATLKRRGAKSVSNCMACHKEADRGYYEDDD